MKVIKKIMVLVLTFAMVVSLSSCIAYKLLSPVVDELAPIVLLEVEELEAPYENYYLMGGGGSYWICNYNPKKLLEIPTYRESIMYGSGAGDNVSGIVYAIEITDSVNNMEYKAEINALTMEIGYEVDNMFSSDEEKSAEIDRLIGMIDSIMDVNI